jgi:RNA polymerase sigma factor (sigma-70 family)
VTDNSSTAQRQNIVQVVRGYGKRLFGFIRQRVPNDADAEDVLQDVWFQLSQLVDLDSVENIGAWLFRVTRNKLTDRSRKRLPENLEDLAYEDEDGETHYAGDLLLADFATPEDEYLRGLFWDTLFAALDELPENQRNVFIWNELEDQTFQVMADRTGENIKTLISRKRYAVQHLRRRLEDFYQELINY